MVIKEKVLNSEMNFKLHRKHTKQPQSAAHLNNYIFLWLGGVFMCFGREKNSARMYHTSHRTLFTIRRVFSSCHSPQKVKQPDEADHMISPSESIWPPLAQLWTLIWTPGLSLNNTMCFTFFIHTHHTTESNDHTSEQRCLVLAS